MLGTSVVARHTRSPRSRKPISLFRFLASKGGLKPHCDLAYILDGNPFVPGYGCLIRKRGMTLDAAREACVQNDYMMDAGDHTGGLSESTTRELLDKIAEEARGNLQFVPWEQPIDECSDDMTADEYRYSIERLGLSQVAAAKALGVDPRTSRRWANDERSIPEPVAILLRLMLANKKD